MNQMGTKLTCDHCQCQVIVTKGGQGTVLCHGQPMRVSAGGGARPAGAPAGPGAGEG